MRRIVCMFITILLFLSPTINAHANDNTALRTALTLTFKDENENPLENIGFRMYRIGTYKSGQTGTTYSYTLSDWASGYPVSLDDIDWDNYGDVTALTGTLQGYIMTDTKNPTPYKTASTGHDGNVIFEEVESGLYLIIGDSLVYKDGGVTVLCTPQSVLVPLPYPSGQANGYGNHEVVLDLKRDTAVIEDTTQVTVIKKWEGSENHPSSVNIQLLKDWESYEDVTLDESNNWKYTWTNLEAGHTWRVTEENVPDSYTVSVEQDNTVFTVTNTGNSTTVPAPQTPSTEVQPSPTEKQPSETTTVWETIKTGEINIIPAIIGIAIMAITAGMLIYRKKKA